MNSASSSLDPFVRLAIYLTLPVAYVGAAWLTYRRWGGRALGALWIGVSVAVGYLTYRSICAQGHVCDVIGTSRLFLSSNPYYFTHYVSRFSALALAAFGAASFVVVRRHKRGSTTRLWPGTLILGVAAAISIWILGSAVLAERI